MMKVQYKIQKNINYIQIIIFYFMIFFILGYEVRLSNCVSTACFLTPLGRIGMQVKPTVEDEQCRKAHNLRRTQKQGNRNGLMFCSLIVSGARWQNQDMQAKPTVKEERCRKGPDISDRLRQCSCMFLVPRGKIRRNKQRRRGRRV